jgi:hypothetical protein
MLSTRIHDLPKKWRARAHGDAGLIALADELEEHLKDAALCDVSTGPEVHVEVIVPESVFEATITKPTSCTLSTKSGDTRKAVLVFG